MEISDPGARELQQKHIAELRSIAAEIEAHHFPYHFYFSRVLDIDEQQQRKAEQRSIRFDKFAHQTVLEITGNYYASYSAEVMGEGARARQTFLDVMLPMLQAMVRRFPGEQAFQAYALEVSYHVRHKIVGIRSENPENLALILPREAAEKLVAATTPEQQQVALLEGKAYLDTQPTTLWLTGDPPADIDQQHKRAMQTVEIASVATSPAPAPVGPPAPTVSPTLVKAPELPVRLIAPDTLNKLQNSHAATVERLVRDLDAQAHFVSYAPPSFIAFHQAAYLQLSLTTNLERASSSSRYVLAALAFDDHVSHLVRPVLAYFSDASDFDGVDFSTTVKLPGSEKAQSVEFFFPFQAMRCYAQYDCTGQQLINAGFVLINGERAGLDLQSAEGR